MKPRLSAVSIAVKDLQLLRKFYTEVFNWEIKMENEHIIILKLNASLLSLCSEQLFTDYTGTTPSEGKNSYLTINLDTEDEIDQLFNEFKDIDATIIKSPQKVFWGGYVGFIADPEGNLWEIACNNSRNQD